MGRARFKPTDEERVLVEKLSGVGLSQKDICSLIRDGIVIDTLEKYFRRELDQGMAKAHAKAADSLFKRAVNGSDALLIFYIKTQLKWSAPKDEADTYKTKGDTPNEIATNLVQDMASGAIPSTLADSAIGVLLKQQ
jgi:hypothetical protein